MWCGQNSEVAQYRVYENVWRLAFFGFCAVSLNRTASRQRPRPLAAHHGENKLTEKTTAPKARKKQTLTGTPQAPVQRATAQIPNFDDLPDSAMARQSQLIRDPKHPTRPSPLPFSAATLWRKVREGTFPAPTKLGAAISAWCVGDVRAWIRAQSEAA